MNDSPDSFNASYDKYDDEISITELLHKLWTRRGLIVFLPLIFAGLTIAGLLLTKSVSNERLSYYVSLNGIRYATADGVNGVKETRYPNGTTFSPQDLLNPKVVSELANEFDLASANALTQSLQVQFGSPVSNGILAEYESALAANSKATPEELARTNERYQPKLLAAAKSSLSISLNYGALGLSKSQGEELLRKLPQTWNRVFVSEFNIFLNTGVLALPLNTDSINLYTTVGAFEADQSLDIITTGLNLLKDDSRFRSIISDGETPASTLAEVELFRNLYFDPIFTESFTEVSGLSSVYRRDLGLQLKEYDAQLTELNSRINVIQEIQQNTSSQRISSGRGSSSGSDVQLGAGALGSLVNLSKAASLAEYLQETLDKRLTIVSEQSVITTRMAKMGLGGDSSNGIEGATLDANFYVAALARFSRIQDNYSGLLAQAQATALAETPSLYQVSTEIIGEKLFQRRDFLFGALALALGGMLAIVTALLWPTKQQ